MRGGHKDFLYKVLGACRGRGLAATPTVLSLVEVELDALDVPGVTYCDDAFFVGYQILSGDLFALKNELCAPLVCVFVFDRYKLALNHLHEQCI